MGWSAKLWAILILLAAGLALAEFVSRRVASLRFISPLTFFTGLPRLARVLVVTLPLLLGMGAGLGQCMKQQGRLEERLVEARKDKIVAQHETNVATRATELAEETHRDTERVREVVARAEEEIADAVQQADFDNLWSVYARSYCGVFDDPGCAGGPDPAPSRSDPLRGPESDRA